VPAGRLRGLPGQTGDRGRPFPPAASDQIGRVVAQKLQEKLGGSFIIDNKAGATGTIGAAFVKRAPPMATRCWCPRSVRS
jgi:hypothetical protein